MAVKLTSVIFANESSRLIAASVLTLGKSFHRTQSGEEFEMGPNTQLLCARLRDVIRLLERVGASYWADWMQTSLARIERSDFSGVEKVCAACGGMGSFNDLIIQIGAHQIAASEVDAANEELERLRGEIYELAMLIKRDVVIE